MTSAECTLVGAYRFDDPAGEVGIEAHLVATSAGIVHVPLTYRSAEVDGGAEWLVGTMEHSVLGTRWIYDASGDAVFVNELLRVILTGGSHVEQFVATDEGPVARPSTAAVRGSGVPGIPAPRIDTVDASFDGASTTIRATGLTIVVRHILAAPVAVTGPTLTGTWPGSDTPTVLAHIIDDR